MSVRLQRLTPYRQSLKWTIQSNYYEARGAAAWRSGEVPSDVTSNYRAAYQHAQLLLASLDAQYPRGVPKREQIYVLELASGLGTYCANFFRAFEDACRAQRKTYHHQLHYYFTDVVQGGLDAAASNPYLAGLQQEGRLSFTYLDALKPRGPFKRGQLHAVVGNYVFCVLPTTIFKKKGSAFFEKHIELTYEGSDLSSAQVRRLVQRPTESGFARKLSENSTYLPIKLGKRVRDAALRNALVDVTAPRRSATFTFPEGSVEALDALLPYLRRGGLVIITDKAYARALDLRYPRLATPNTHGNSYSHTLNTPLLQLYLERKGHGALRTADYAYGVQTLVATRSVPSSPQVARTFEQLFVAENYNEHASSWVSAARDAMALHRWSTAEAYLRRALRWRRNDAKVTYRLGVCAWQLGRTAEAERLLKRGSKLDVFSEHPWTETLERVRSGNHDVVGLNLAGLGSGT